jgi:hypothetical protein
LKELFEDCLPSIFVEQRYGFHKSSMGINQHATAIIDEDTSLAPNACMFLFAL